MNMIKMQLGKQGLTDSFLETLKKSFENIENIRLSVLKSACRDKQELKEISDKILDFLGPHYTSKIIGYTLILKKWRKPRI